MPPPLKLPVLLAPLLLAAAIAPAPKPPATPAPAATSAPAPAQRPLPGLVKVEFPLLGVRVSALDASPTAENPWPLTLSADYGSVRVEINLNMKSMADFMKLYKSWGSRRGLKTLLDKNVSANEWVVEYAGGSLGGEKMHTYGRALLVNGKVYFPEATATEKEWAQGGARLKACVDSFELMPPPGPAQPAASATAATVTKAEFPQAGFRIAPLDDAATPSTYHTIIGTTFRPAIVQVFTVTLGVETYTKTMAEYAAEVKKGPNSPEYKYLLQLPLGKIISEKFPDSNSWVAETDFGPDYKHYVRFVLANGRMFSMSALLPSDEKKWPGLAARMKECVDSLEAMETPKAAPAK